VVAQYCDSYILHDRGSIPGRDSFSSLSRPDRLWGPPSLLSNRYQGVFSPRVIRQGREADHSSPANAEIKTRGAIHLFPHTSSWRGYLVKHRDSFIFVLCGIGMIALCHIEENHFYLNSQ
jgi:hypothetical protein